MIYRVFPNKDTFITNAKKRNTPQTGSNFGASEILELFKEAGVSGTTGYAASASIGRILLQFDLDEIAALTASSVAPTTGQTYYLRLYDAQHAGKLPSSFDIEVSFISQSWSEGKGIDNDNYSDHGVANWEKASTSVWWDTTGSDFVTSSLATYNFDTGHEDVELDVSSIVGAWLTGGMPNYGFMIKLTNTEEWDANHYYTKKFHARNTHFLDRRPTLEMRWDDSIKDQRHAFLFDITSSLYLYNKERGQLTNITGVGTGNDVLTVDIRDLSGTIATVSASHTGLTGIYSASFALATGSYSGSAFSDAWSLNSKSYMTGAFTPHNDGASSDNEQQHYQVQVKNLKREYEISEKARLNLFVKTRNYNPAVVNTGSLTLHNTVIEKGYYRIDNALTNRVIIPLGTGSTETTRLSYDNNGNYFSFYMNSLAQGEVYKIVFFFDIDGQLQKIDNDYRFRVK